MKLSPEFSWNCSPSAESRPSDRGAIAGDSRFVAIHHKPELLPESVGHILPIGPQLCPGIYSAKPVVIQAEISAHPRTIIGSCSGGLLTHLHLFALSPFFSNSRHPPLWWQPY
jgi:hypothetical protein